MDNRKIQRINSDIYRILSLAISQKLENGHIYGVGILDVQTSADLSLAKVFVSIDAADNEEESRVLAALESASCFLRSEIARSMNLKNTPKIRFLLDKGKANAHRVEELLEQIRKTEGK